MSRFVVILASALFGSSCSSSGGSILNEEVASIVGTDASDERPLTPQGLRELIDEAHRRVSQIGCYTCLLYKRERVDGELLDTQKAVLKIRHEPFSVYLRFLEPGTLAGQEAIYVRGRHADKLVGHSTGLLGLLGTFHLDPEGSTAMKGNRYPITGAGMLHLLDKIDATCSSDAVEDCVITAHDGVLVDDRKCVRVELVNPHPSDEFAYSRVCIVFDPAAHLPVHFEAFTAEGGGGEVLVERYTFTNVVADGDLSDRDFDPDNPEYGY